SSSRPLPHVLMDQSTYSGLSPPVSMETRQPMTGLFSGLNQRLQMEEAEYIQNLTHIHLAFASSTMFLHLSALADVRVMRKCRSDAVARQPVLRFQSWRFFADALVEKNPAEGNTSLCFSHRSGKQSSIFLFLEHHLHLSCIDGSEPVTHSDLAQLQGSSRGSIMSRFKALCVDYWQFLCLQPSSVLLKRNIFVRRSEEVFRRWLDCRRMKLLIPVFLMSIPAQSLSDGRLQICPRQGDSPSLAVLRLQEASICLEETGIVMSARLVVCLVALSLGRPGLSQPAGSKPELRPELRVVLFISCFFYHKFEEHSLTVSSKLEHIRKSSCPSLRPIR
ncbi:hypothetical protein DNTS_005279, partial [Danionella cerebrum]